MSQPNKLPTPPLVSEDDISIYTEMLSDWFRDAGLTPRASGIVTAHLLGRIVGLVAKDQDDLDVGMRTATDAIIKTAMATFITRTGSSTIAG